MYINKIVLFSFLIFFLQRTLAEAIDRDLVPDDDTVIIINESKHPVVVTYNAGCKKKHELAPQARMTLSRECLIKITHRLIRFAVRKRWIFDGQLNSRIKTITIPDASNALISELLARQYQYIFHNTGVTYDAINSFASTFLDAALLLHSTPFEGKSFTESMETAQQVLEDREKETGLAISTAKKLHLLLATLEKHIELYIPYQDLRDQNHQLFLSFKAINGEKKLIHYLTPSHRSGKDISAACP